MGTLTIIWNPLPTLDLTGIDPDILYTVELFKITCGQNVLVSHKVVAESSVTEESLDLMQIYKAVIAARNNVTAARNRPTVEIGGIILCDCGVINNTIVCFVETFMSFSMHTLFKLARNSQISVIVSPLNA